VIEKVFIPILPMLAAFVLVPILRDKIKDDYLTSFKRDIVFFGIVFLFFWSYVSISLEIFGTLKEIPHFLASLLLTFLSMVSSFSSWFGKLSQ